VRPFHRRFGKYTGWLEPAEASLIADLVDQVRQLLAGRRTETHDEASQRFAGRRVV